MVVEDLDWGGCKRLSWGPAISENMIDRASIWIDDDHPILSDFEMLSSPPETGPALYANGNKDILRNHLLKRIWIWITRMHHLKRVIDIPRNGNDRLSNPLEALEAARYFISAVRLELNPHRIPEVRHVERESNWAEEWIKSRPEERKLTWSNQQKEFILNRLAGRGSEPLIDWQLTGEKLYNLQAFCPQTEAGCALALLLHHQELAVLRKEFSKTKDQEKLPAFPPLRRVPIVNVTQKIASTKKAILSIRPDLMTSHITIRWVGVGIPKVLGAHRARQIRLLRSTSPLSLQINHLHHRPIVYSQ
jgi:hypothetical protein